MVSNMDRLTSMAVFVKVVDVGSFAAAANILEMSGPMVGKHINALEKHLGAQLLNRTTRRQNLTEFGQAYYEQCLVVFNAVKAGEALAADQSGEPIGRLRISMPVHFGRLCVAPILLKLANRYPKLELDLSFSDRFIDLGDEEVDLAIRTGSLGNWGGIVARHVANQRMIVCASPEYLVQKGVPNSIADIANHWAVVYRRMGRVRPWIFPRKDLPPVEIMPLHRLRFDDLDSIAEAAVSGAGLAWLPSWLVQARLQSGALVHLFPNELEYPYEVSLLWLQRPHIPLKLRVAIDTLKLELPKYM